MNEHNPAIGNLEAQLLGLSTLVQLGNRARGALSLLELAFIMVNETHALVPYRQAALWRRDRRGAGKVLAISGAATVETGAHFSLWLERALAAFDAATKNSALRAVERATLPSALAGEWAEWLPEHGLWVPLATSKGEILGALFLARDLDWSEGEQFLVRELGDIYAFVWAALGGLHRRGLRWAALRRNGRVKLGVALLIVAVLMMPVSQSVLAPAEVVAYQPAVVRAPLDGVVERIDVAPNQDVREGDLLLELDPRTVENRLAVADKALAVAEAEYRQAAQQALFDDKSRNQLSVLKGHVDERREEVAYDQSLLDRIRVKSPRAGIVVVEDPSEWIGRPVSLGERILTVADPTQAEIEIHLPAADAIPLPKDAALELFLYSTPETPVAGRVRFLSYDAVLGPDGTLSYVLKARFDGGGPPPRIGLRGTAKVYGQRVSLFYHLMRRPLATFRQMLGF
jgi:hypothetical protein